MTIKNALIQGNQILRDAKITSASNEGRLLLCFVINKSLEFSLTNPEYEISKTQLNKFKKIIAKRATHYPIAYITGKKYFFNEPFFVNESVLIPRPETEIIINEAQKIIHNKKISVCEIGTGSGCISITLSRLNTKSQFIATDISPAALTVAKRNNSTHKTKVRFLLGNLVEPIRNKKIDLLIANLPYIPNNLNKLTKSIHSKSILFEPKLALTAGPDGLDLYRKLFSQIAKMQNKPKHILIEIGENQTNKIKRIIKKYLLTPKIVFIKDLRGLNRTVRITLG